MLGGPSEYRVSVRLRMRREQESIAVQAFFILFEVLQTTVRTFDQVFVNSGLFRCQMAGFFLEQGVGTQDAVLNIERIIGFALLVIARDGGRRELSFFGDIVIRSRRFTYLTDTQEMVVVEMTFTTPPLGAFCFDFLLQSIFWQVLHLNNYYKVHQTKGSGNHILFALSFPALPSFAFCVPSKAGTIQTVYKFKIMNDKKFEALRKKLDILGFPQTLNPDTFELVDKMYSQLFKCMTELDQERKKRIDNAQSSADTVILYDRIESLTAQRDTLSRQLQEARSGATQKENDDRIRNLTMLVNNFKIKQEESMLDYEREVKQLSGDIASLKIRNDQIERENQMLKNRSTLNSSESERYTAELTSLVQKKSKEIKELEDSNSKLRIRVQILQRNIEENKYSANETKDEGRGEAEKLQSILKQELGEAEMRYRQVKSELEETRDDNENLRKDLRRAREEVLILKKEETNTKTLENIGKMGKQKMEQLYEESRQQLSLKLQELKSVKDQLQSEAHERGRLEVKVKQLFNKSKFLGDKNADLQTEIEHMSEKLTLQVRKVRELQANNASLEKQLKQIHDESTSQNREFVQQGVREQQMKIQQMRKEAVIKDRDFKLLSQELDILKNQVKERVIEKDKAQMDVRKLQGIIAQGSRNLQTLQLQKEELMKENRELRSGKQILTSADSTTKNEMFVLKERLQASEGQIEQLRSILHSEQIRNQELQSEITKMQSVLTQSQQKNVQIFEDNRQMAGQIKILEQRKNQLHEKVKELQEKTHMHLEGNSENRREMDQLTTRCEELQRQLVRKDKALKQLDLEKDQLQNQLDQQTLERSNLKDQLSRFDGNLMEYSRALEEREFTINDLQKKLSRSEDNRENLERQHQRLVEEDVKLRDRLMASEAELRSIHNEINLLVISNQQAQKQAERGKNKVAELDKKLKDKIRQNQDQRQRATAMSILSNELQLQLERERAQVVRLRGFLGELEDANNDMYQQLQKKDHDLEEMSRVIEESDRKEQQYIHEINSYQRQLEQLTSDLDAMHNQTRMLSGDREKLRMQNNWKNDVKNLTQDWRTKQEERYVSLQREYQRVKMQNEQLKHRCRDLEDLLSEERAKNCRASQNSSIINRPILVESRVESYHQSQNFNNSNVFERSRQESLQSIDNISQESAQYDIVQSAKSSLLEIERKYLQASFPNSRPGLPPNS